MRGLAERAYFFACLALGRLLRAGRYSKTRIDYYDTELPVRKHRSFHAPLLVWLGEPLVRILDTAVRVLPQGDWDEHERLVYHPLHGRSIRFADGTRFRPRFPGEPLATLLQDPELDESFRKRAVEL